jgi:hypothetical protein
MTMRDKIADIIDETLAYDYDGSVSGITDAADAILAALPDMIAPLVWEKAIIESTGSGSREDFGGWTMVAKTPLKVITIDFHEQWERKGVRYPYYSNTCGGFQDEAEAIKATNTHHRAAIMAAFTGEKK